MSFQDFILALSELATRKYGGELPAQAAFNQLYREVRSAPQCGLRCLYAPRPLRGDCGLSTLLCCVQHFAPLKERFAGGMSPLAAAASGAASGLRAAASDPSAKPFSPTTSSVLPDPEELRQFHERLCQPEVVRACLWCFAPHPRRFILRGLPRVLAQLAFFNDNKESLYALFLRFAQADTPAGSVSWTAIRDSNVTLSEKEFVKVRGRL